MEVVENKNYKTYIGGIVNQLQDYLPDASFMVFNFREGENQSQIKRILSEYDMNVIDYPRQYERCPVLTLEMILHCLKSGDSWLLLGSRNVLLMHCELGGWPILAFMLSALLLYRKLYIGEQKTLDMIYKQAPRELLQLMSPLNPTSSQLRYLQYISRRNLDSEWPPIERGLKVDCVMLRIIPNIDGVGGCRPILRIYGRDPSSDVERAPTVLFATPKSRLVRKYKQKESELVKIDVNCHVQGDVVLECLSLEDDLKGERMMFRVMFNTSFIRSNILMLTRDDIDTLRDDKDCFPKNFKAEVLFSEIDSETPKTSYDITIEKSKEILRNVDRIDLKPNVDSSLEGISQPPLLSSVSFVPERPVFKNSTLSTPSPPPPSPPPPSTPTLSPPCLPPLGTPAFEKSTLSTPPLPPPPPPPPSPLQTLAFETSTLSTPPVPPPPPPPPLKTPAFETSTLSVPPLQPPPPPPPLKTHAFETSTLSTPPLPPPPPPPPPLETPAFVMSTLSTPPLPPPPPSPPPPPLPTLSLATQSDIGSSFSSPLPPPPPPPSPPENVLVLPPPPPLSTPLPPPPAPPVKGPPISNGSSQSGQGKTNNGPIPPPPGPPRGKVPPRPTSRNQGQSKKNNLKPYHWSKLSRVTQGSLWAEAQPPEDASKGLEFDMSEIENLFAVSDNRVSGGQSRSHESGHKTDKVQLIDVNRARNCEIMLTRVKIPLSDLMNSVLALDDSALDVDQVENLVKFCPTKEEMELLKGYTGDIENLGKCEQFFLELMKVPHVESKLRVFCFKIQFRTQVSDLRKNLLLVNSVSEEVRSSVKLKRLMRTILSLGNALNQGTARGAALGFRLDSLLKLNDTHSRDDKVTLMHYLCKVVAEKLPELLDFPNDLVSLEGSTKIQLKILAEEMQAITKGLKKVVQELNSSENDGPISENFRKIVKDFLSYAEGEVKSLEALYTFVGKNADSLARYFSEDPGKVPFEQVVMTLQNFVKMFLKAHEENCKHLELEKKKAEREAENEKSKPSFETRIKNSDHSIQSPREISSL